MSPQLRWMQWKYCQTWCLAVSRVSSCTSDGRRNLWTKLIASSLLCASTAVLSPLSLSQRSWDATLNPMDCKPNNCRTSIRITITEYQRLRWWGKSVCCGRENLWGLLAGWVSMKCTFGSYLIPCLGGKPLTSEEIPNMCSLKELFKKMSIVLI